VVTSARKRSADFLLLLARLDRLHGPAPGRPERPVVLVLDNGPIHTSKATAKALAARPWLTVKWLPKYAPELNAIEHRWRDLKAHFLAHQTFASADHLDAAIHRAVQDLNRERQTQTCSRPMQGCLEPWLEHSEQLIGKATASYTSASSS
jgi:transposase